MLHHVFKDNFIAVLLLFVKEKWIKNFYISLWEKL